MSFHWPDEAIADAKRLWMEGHSSSMISDEISRKYGNVVSRNAVIGKLQRLGIDNTSRGMKPGHTRLALPPRFKAPRPRPVAFVEKRGPALKPQPPLRMPVALEDLSFARPWEERERGQCAWPIGEPGAILSCCAPTDAKYCAAHYARMFRPNTALDKGAIRQIVRRAA